MSSLKKSAVHGAKWTGVSKVGTAGLQFVQLVILGHLLDPEDFGLMSMVMVVMGFAQAYMDMGISNALIHKQDSTRRQLSTLYWINIIAGIVLFVAINLSSPLIISFYKEPQLKGLIFLISFIFLVTPVGQQFYVLLEKQLRFRLLAIIELISYLSGVVASVLLALKGFGVYSLIWGYLVNVGLRTIFTSFIGFREFTPRLVFAFSGVRDYVSFGLYQMGGKTSNYLAKNVDYLLIGRYFGSDVLGAYTIAFQLILAPVQKINPILTRVAFPIFSKHQNDNHILRKGYFKLSEFLSFVSYPVLIFLAFTADILIPVLFGSGWGLTVSLLPVLVIVGLIRTLGNPVGSIYLAKGRADIGFYFDASIAVLNLVAFWIAAQYSVYHVAITFALLNILYYLAHRYVIDQLIESDWSQYISYLWKNIVIALVSGIVISVVQDFYFTSNILGVMGSVITMLGVYILIQYLFNKKYLKEVYLEYIL